MSNRVGKNGAVTPEFQAMLQHVLKTERQWLRPHRIQRAQFMVRNSSSQEEKRLWEAVVKANSY